MTRSGKRKPGVPHTDHSGEAFHHFAVARVHELHLLAERCTGPRVKVAVPAGHLTWWRKLLRDMH